MQSESLHEDRRVQLHQRSQLPSSSFPDSQNYIFRNQLPQKAAKENSLLLAFLRMWRKTLLEALMQTDSRSEVLTSPESYSFWDFEENEDGR